MARVHFVKAARKDNPVAKKGESYYWWKPKVGGYGGAKRYSKEQPTRSQTTQSEFLSQQYAIEDQIATATSKEDLEAAAEAFRELGQEQQEKLDNMPESLQQGASGELLQERIDGCESWADEIDRIANDLGDEPEESDSDGEDPWEDPWEDRLEAARDEALSACPF